MQGIEVTDRVAEGFDVAGVDQVGGFRRLSDLVEASGDNFKVERREDGFYVKRLR